VWHYPIAHSPALPNELSKTCPRAAKAGTAAKADATTASIARKIGIETTALVIRCPETNPRTCNKPRRGLIIIPLPLLYANTPAKTTAGVSNIDNRNGTTKVIRFGLCRTRVNKEVTLWEDNILLPLCSVTQLDDTLIPSIEE
jgi:hypothetical protein